MRNKLTWLLLLVGLVINSSYGANGNLTGDGSINSPYLIQDYQDFAAYVDPAMYPYWDVGKHVRLETDLDLDPSLDGRVIYTSAVIGGFFQNRQNDFAGFFHGNGHTISNTIIQGDFSTTELGFFGNINAGAVYELNLVNCQIKAATTFASVGMLAGSVSFNGIIENCHVAGAISTNSTLSGVGGLIGVCAHDPIIRYCSADVTFTVPNANTAGGFVGNASGIISYCFATGTVTGSSDVGGFVGVNTGYINACTSSGNVQSSAITIGGFAGSNLDGKIVDCYTTSTVNGGKNIFNGGGFVGSNNSGKFIHCYANNNMYGQASFYLGKFIGKNFQGDNMLVSCFYNKDTIGPANGVGDPVNSPGVTGLTTIQMGDINNFLDAGWKFTGHAPDYILPVWEMADTPHIAALGKIAIDAQNYQVGDLNSDNSTDIIDLAILTQNWLAE